MQFRELYEFSASLPDDNVRFKDLWRHVNAHHTTIGNVEVYAVPYDPPRETAHFVRFHDRTSPYEPQFIVHQIRYCSTLEEHPRTKRLYKTKELMHVFDSKDEQVSSREEFIKFLEEMESVPLSADQSKRFVSENKAKWMAILILCTKEKRAKAIAEIGESSNFKYEFAGRFDIPSDIVEAVLGDYYDVAHEKLIV